MIEFTNMEGTSPKDGAHIKAQTMEKHIRKALRIKGMKFYLSPVSLSHGYDWNRSTATTKKRVSEYVKSIKLMRICESVYTDHAQNFTFIYFNHAENAPKNEEF